MIQDLFSENIYGINNPYEHQNGVILYNEFSKKFWPTALASTCATELGAFLLSDALPKEKHLIIETELSKLGFDGFEYGQMSFVLGKLDALSLLTSHTPSNWVGTYYKQRLWTADFRFNLCDVCCTPAIWSVQQQIVRERLLPRPHAHALQFLQALLNAGICSGITVLMPDIRSNKTTVMHWLSRHADLRGVDKQVLSNTLMMGLGVHECLSQMKINVHTNKNTSEQLTQQQSSVVKCLVQGMGNKAIARALSISTHTVDYHLRVLRHKFNTTSRTQLASIIVSQQLV
jgi:DNA-binding CsgD family transcriptional regulator